jgi:hypothetical protein
MVNRGILSRLCACLALVCVGVLALAQSGPTVTTDKGDYAPGELVAITGTGWYPNQTVTLQVVHSDGTATGENHDPFTTTSDADGNISATWNVETDDGLGASFVLSAKCAPDGMEPELATWFFTDKSGTTVTITPSANPATYPNGVLYTIVVSSAPQTPAPTGTVDITIDGTDIGARTLATLSSTSAQVISSQSLAGGSHTIRVDYNGDGNYLKSNNTITQVINPAVSSLTLSSSPNPSFQGGQVTYTATATGVAGGATPFGTVTFKDGATTLGTQTLNGLGVATFPNSTLSVGSHTITAVFAGDFDYASSTSNSVTQVVTAKIDTTMTLLSSLNPSNQGQSVTFTATLTPASGSVVPTGHIDFHDGATTIGSGNIDGTGTATFTTSALTAGTHSITGVYGGDTGNNGSTSPAVSQVVIGTTTTAVASNHNPSVIGQSVTFTATVTASSGTATGTVAFMDGATTLGTGTLSGTTATFSTSSLAVGTHSITAVYGGSAGFTGSTSPNLSQVVNLGATTTTVVSNLNPSLQGQSVTFTATVSATSPATGTPTGIVTFKDGASTLGTGTLSGNTATFSTSALSIATHTISAVYGGDSSFNGSTSSNLSQVVNNPSTTLTINSSVNPSTYNQSVTFTARLTNAGGNFSGQTITFTDGATTIGTANTNGGGNATVSISTLTAGSHTITASYAGANGFSTSSASLTQTVNKATATVTITNTTQAYDGNPKSVTTTTNPIGLTVNVTYNGSSTPPTNAGSYPVVATISDANYQGSNNATLTINKAAAVLTLSGLNTTYNGNPQSVTVSTNPANLTVVSVTYNGSSTPPTNAGSYPVVATLNNTNYTGTASGTFVVAKATPTVNVTGGTFPYDGNSHPATGSVIGVNAENLGTPTFTYTPGGAAAPVSAGSYAVLGSFAGNTNYNSATGSANITINKADQTINFGALADKTFGDPSFNVNATATSGLAVSFSVLSGPATISGNTVTTTGAGSVTIRASQAGNTDYNAAPNVDQSFNVGKATPTVTANGGTFTYDGNPHPATGSVTGVGGADLGAPAFVYTPGGATPPTNAGTYSATGSFAGDANYNAASSSPATITINKATASLQITDTDQTYDSTPRPVTLTTTPGGLTGVTVTYNGSATAPTDAGTYPVVAHLENDNYSATDATATLTVHKAHATLSLSGLSATYNGSPHAVTATTSPASLATVTVTYDGSAAAPTNAGSYAVVAHLDNANYDATDATSILVIAKADQAITFNALTDKHFGDADEALSATADSGLTVSFAATAPATITGNTMSFPANGGTTVTITVTASQAGDANHNAAPDVQRTFQLLENVKPTSTADVQPVPNAAGWDKANVTVTITATDNAGGDGVKEIHYSVDGGSDTAVPGNVAVVNLTADGTHHVSYHAVDNAGNVEAAQDQIVKIDQTAPVLSANPDRSPDSNGWYTAPLDITFSGDDGSGSGVDNTTLTAPIHYAGPDSKSAYVEGDVSDIAGNASHKVFHFKYDATAPDILVTGLAGTVHESVTYHISASDHGSGADILLEVTLKKDNVTVWTWSGTDVAPAAPEQSISGAANDGHYHLDVKATDEAGHVTTQSYDFAIDNEAPVIEFLPSSPADGGIYNSAQTISYTITDAFDTITSTIETLLQQIANTDIGPSPITSGATVSQEGKYTVHLEATDELGHHADTDRTFTIDLTKPVVDDAAVSGSLAPNPGWFESDVAVTLSASDPNIRLNPTLIEGSGVKEIRYYATGAQPIADSGNPTVVGGNTVMFNITTQGVTTITYWAIDNAGNVGDSKTVTVKYDKTPPAFDAISDITTTADKADGKDVTFTLPTPTDNVDPNPSIVASPASGSTFGVGDTTVTVTASDAAGQTFQRTFKVAVNNPVPVLTSIDPATKTFGDGSFTMTLTGDKFMPNSVVKVDGDVRPTTFVSFAELQAQIPASDMNAAGTKQVSVTTPTPGGGTSGNVTFTIDKKHQTITFDAIPNKTYGDAPFNVNPTSDSGLDVSVAITSGPATISGGTITITGAGLVTVTASQPGDANHYAADDVVRTFTVAKAKPTVTVTGGTLIYDTHEHPATGSVKGVFGEDLSDPTFNYTPGGSTAPTNAGTYQVKATFAGNDNYEAGEATAQIVIQKADQTTNFGTIPNHTYGDTPFTLSATAASGLDVSFSVFSGPATIVGNTLTISGAGTVVVRAAQAGDSNYNAAPNVDQTFEVAKATPVVHVTGGTFVYDGNPHAAIGSIDAVNGDNLGQPAFTYTPGGVNAPVHAGTYDVLASFAGNANYNSASATAQILINKADQTISFAALADKTYGDSPITLAATSDSGLAVSFALVFGPATVSANTLTITGVGTVVVRASQLGNEDFNPAPTFDRSFNVDKATPAITVVGGTFTFDGNPHPATGTLTGVNGDNLGTPVFDYSPGGSTAPVHAGTYQVIASFAGNANYNPVSKDATIVINKAHATIALSNLSFTYDGNPHTATATTTPPSLPGVTVTYDGSTTAPTNAGSYAVVAHLDNPDWEATDSTDTLAIAKATATVHITGGTFTYDGNPHAATATVTGVNNEDLGAVTISYAPGGSNAPVNAGDYNATGDFLGNANYNSATANAPIKINKAHATITLSNLHDTYDGNSHSATATTSPLGLSGVTLTYAGGSTLPIHAGSYAVQATLDNQNYEASSANDTLVIDKANPTVHVDSVHVTFDNSPHAATGSATGVNAEDLGPLSFNYTPGGSAIPTHAGTYSVVGSYAGSGDYNPGSANGTVQIDKADQTINFGPLAAHTYGDAPITLSSSATSGLPVGFSVVSGPGSLSSNVLTITGAGTIKVRASQAGNGDYNAAANVDLTFNVAKATPVVNVTGGTFTYDGNGHSATGTITGVNGDVMPVPVISYTPSVIVPKDAGTYLATGSFAGNGNYNPASSTANVVINKANLTVTADNKSKMLNAANPPLTGVITGAVATDGISATYATAATQTSDVGMYPITPTLVDPNNRLGNYNVTKNNGTLNIGYKNNSGVLQPLNQDGSSVNKQGSTIPVKFQVFDTNGVSIGTPGVVVSFNLVQIIKGTVSQTVNETPVATNNDTAFRYDGQWIFNLNTKNLAAGQTYVYRITLKDGSFITFQFGLR